MENIIKIKTEDLTQVEEVLKTINVDSIEIKANQQIACLLCSFGIIDSCDEKSASELNNMDYIFHTLLDAANDESDNFENIINIIFWAHAAVPNHKSVNINISSKLYKEIINHIKIFLEYWQSGDSDEDEYVSIAIDPVNLNMLAELARTITKLKNRMYINPCEEIFKDLDYAINVVKPLLSTIHYELSSEAIDFAITQALRGI